MDPVHRISIVARGMSLGYTLIPPQRDIVHETKTHLVNQITAMLGGRAAEEFIFNEITTGAANDFNQATAVAREMVTEYGMSSLGPINLGDSFDITSWSRGETTNLSQETLAKVDAEVSKLINSCYKKAVTTVKEHKDKLHAVAKELLEKETLDQDEFEKIMKG